jgi:hypothetical protein
VAVLCSLRSAFGCGVNSSPRRIYYSAGCFPWCIIKLTTSAVAVRLLLRFHTPNTETTADGGGSGRSAALNRLCNATATSAPHWLDADRAESYRRRRQWLTIHTEGCGSPPDNDANVLRCDLRPIHSINSWSSGVELISPLRVLSISPCNEYDLNFPASPPSFFFDSRIPVVTCLFNSSRARL